MITWLTIASGEATRSRMSLLLSRVVEHLVGLEFYRVAHVHAFEFVLRTFNPGDRDATRVVRVSADVAALPLINPPERWLGGVPPPGVTAGWYINPEWLDNPGVGPSSKRDR
jgi:hypothetical protein